MTAFSDAVCTAESITGKRITEEAAAELICKMKGKRVLILSHRHPDGDTLGCALALKQILKGLGSKADIACADPAPSNCRFLFDGRNGAVAEPAPLLNPAPDDYDKIVSVDTASTKQLGILSFLSDRVCLKIDHHAVGEDYAKENLVDPDAAACAEIIMRIAKIIGTPLKDIMTPLYAGISSDTGGFKYSNTTSKTLRFAAELMDEGVDCGYINHMLFDNHTMSEIRAIRTAYENLELFENGKVALITVTNEKKKENGLSDSDLGVLSSLSRDIEGVLLGIVLKQDASDEKKYRISMRSSEPVDVAEICSKLNGGGHVRAAGGEIIADSVKEAVNTVLCTVKESVKF